MVELKAEIETLKRLEALALEVRRGGARHEVAGAREPLQRPLHAAGLAGKVGEDGHAVRGRRDSASVALAATEARALYRAPRHVALTCKSASRPCSGPRAVGRMQLDSSSGNYTRPRTPDQGLQGRHAELPEDPGPGTRRHLPSYLEGPPFRSICRHVYGDIPIACFRAMAMIKPAGTGTKLPWHQDRWRALDRDPLVTIWTSLDDANAKSGGLEVIPGSHRRGVLNPSHPSAFLDDQQQAQCDGEPERARLDIPAGEVWLLHNWLLHRSGVNETDEPRRAFSVCYMDARTADRNGHTYTPLWD